MEELPHHHFADIERSSFSSSPRVLHSESDYGGVEATRLDRGVASLGHTPQHFAPQFFPDQSRSVVSGDDGQVNEGRRSGRTSVVNGRRSVNSRREGSGRRSRGGDGSVAGEGGGLASYFSDGDLKGFSDVTRQILFGGR